MRLGDLTDMRMGYTARKGPESVWCDGVLAVQLRNIAPDGELDVDGLERFDLDVAAPRYFADQGDVLFRPRGASTVACALGAELPEPVLVLLPLIILRLKTADLLPEFLAWQINQPAAQRALDLAAQGSNLRMIPKSALQDLDIQIPSLGRQHMIVEIDRLARRERVLTHELAEERFLRSAALLSQHIAETGETSRKASDD